MQLNALLRLGFPTATINLTLLHIVTRWLIMQKVCGQALPIALPLVVSIRFQDLFHSPCRGSFHRSLTVLVHYRSVRSIQAWKVVLPDSDKIPRVPSYSGYSPRHSEIRIRGLHPLWRTFPNTSPFLHASDDESYNPGMQAHRFGLIRVRSPLLTKSLFDFSSSRYLDVSVPLVCAPQTNFFICGPLFVTITRFPHSEIFGSLYVEVLSEAYRSFTNVLHRLSLPRYPPYTLNSFCFFRYFN